MKALEEKALGDGSEAAPISNSLKVCVNKLSSRSGKNSCPLNTGIPIESLGIELQYRALNSQFAPNMSDATRRLNKRLCGTTLYSPHGQSSGCPHSEHRTEQAAI